jgi:hypothetical protein
MNIFKRLFFKPKLTREQEWFLVTLSTSITRIK